MKILHLADNLVLGGRERRLLEVIKGLVERGHEITLVLFRNAVHYHEVYDLPVRLIVLQKRFKKDFLVYLKLFKICRKLNPDIIHTWGGVPSVMAIPLTLYNRQKFVNGMIANSVCKPFTKDWYRSRLSFPFSSIIVSNSKIGLKAYNVSAKKGIVVSNGFNFQRLKERPDADTVKQELGILQKEIYVVGMVASINFRKDYPTFIRAALEILRKRRDILFVIIGDGEDRQAVEATIAGEYKGNFNFLGKRQDVDRFVSVFDVGVLATFAEGISNSIMEYMAFGKPVVASDVAGNRELVEDNESGYLVPVGDSSSMAARITGLLDNRELSDKMGKRGIQIIEERFSQVGMTEQYIEMYNKL